MASGKWCPLYATVGSIAKVDLEDKSKGQSNNNTRARLEMGSCPRIDKMYTECGRSDADYPTDHRRFGVGR